MSRVAKAAKSKRPRDARIEAMRLLGKWTTLAQGHVLVGGAGCSCGLAAGSLAIKDFEEQILDYLRGKYTAMEKSESVGDVLRAIAARQADSEPGESAALLADLDRTLESFEDLHRAR